MVQRRTIDVAAGLVLAAFAAVAAVWVIPGQAAPGDEGEIAPALLPIVAAGTIALFALVQAATTYLGHAAERVDFDSRAALFAVVAAVGLAGIVLVFMWFGFRTGGIVAIVAIGLAMRPPRALLIWLGIVAIALPVATYTLAWHGLRLALP